MTKAPPVVEQPFDLYLLIGMLTIKWGMIENEWHGIFLNLHSWERGWLPVHFKPVNALWNSHRSFAGQRQMVLDYAREVIGASEPKLLKELNELNDETGRVSGMRNAVQHSQFVYGGKRDALKVMLSPINPQKRLDGKDIAAELTELIPKVEQLQAGLGFWTLRLLGHNDKYPPPAARPTKSTGS